MDITDATSANPMRRILVVEDEYYLADDMKQSLGREGREVVGPASSVDSAMRLLDEGRPIDGAILDINLRGGQIFPLADELERRNIPFAFATGYDRSVVPDRHLARPYFEKPLDTDRLARELPEILARRQ
jgi:DNA-binding NtrC family response regulator